MRGLFDSPIGKIEIHADSEAVIRLDFIGDNNDYKLNDKSDLIELCKIQLDDYFEGRILSFNIPIKLQGTEFQKKVWSEVAKISFGKTKSYLEIAELIGNKKSIRAVGLANGQNPLPIIIPCHRVIGSNGKLVGYAGGLERKKWLLAHEAKFAKSESQLEIFL